MRLTVEVGCLDLFLKNSMRILSVISFFLSGYFTFSIFHSQGLTLETGLEIEVIFFCYSSYSFLITSVYFPLFIQFVELLNAIYNSYAALTNKTFHWTQVCKLYCPKVDNGFEIISTLWHKQIDGLMQLHVRFSLLSLKKCRNKLCVYTKSLILYIISCDLLLAVLFQTRYFLI